MRVPKFGFTNRNRVEYQGVNIDMIQQLVEQHSITAVTIETLMDYGIVSNAKKPVKILGRGELKAKLTVQANAFTATAKAAIEALGGTAETI
jgi:large subunit ribosomal protein L15